MTKPSFEEFYAKHPVKHPEKLASLDEWKSKYPRTGAVTEDILQGQRLVESAGNDKAISAAGAIGPAQIRPAQIGIKPEAVFNPDDNREVGARHMDKLMRQFNGDIVRALRAYNQGSGNERNRTEDQTPKETKDYPSKVIQASLPFEGGRPDTVDAFKSKYPVKQPPSIQSWKEKWPLLSKLNDLANTVGMGYNTANNEGPSK